LLKVITQNITDYELSQDLMGTQYLRLDKLNSIDPLSTDIGEPIQAVETETATLEEDQTHMPTTEKQIPSKSL
jgi:hypothetical protein